LWSGPWNSVLIQQHQQVTYALKFLMELHSWRGINLVPVGCQPRNEGMIELLALISKQQNSPA